MNYASRDRKGNTITIWDTKPEFKDGFWHKPGHITGLVTKSQFFKQYGINLQPRDCVKIDYIPIEDERKSFNIKGSLRKQVNDLPAELENFIDNFKCDYDKQQAKKLLNRIQIKMLRAVGEATE